MLVNCTEYMEYRRYRRDSESIATPMEASAASVKCLTKWRALVRVFHIRDTVLATRVSWLDTTRRRVQESPTLVLVRDEPTASALHQ